MLSNDEAASRRRSVLEARRIFECEIAALAAERAEDGDLEAMESAIRTMRGSLRDHAVFSRADAAFHRMLLRATRNRALMKMGDSMRELLTFSQQTTSSLPGVLDRALRDHLAIYRAVKRGDGTAARTAMRRHLAATERNVKALLNL